MLTEEPLSELEVQILQGLHRLGGSYQQRNLWKLIGIDSKVGIPILTRLEKRGLIERARVGGEKRGVYVVKLTEEGLNVVRKLLEEKRLEEEYVVKIEGVPQWISLFLEIPCTYCSHALDCGKGPRIYPDRCEILNKWLVERLTRQ